MLINSFFIPDKVYITAEAKECDYTDFLVGNLENFSRVYSLPKISIKVIDNDNDEGSYDGCDAMVIAFRRGNFVKLLNRTGREGLSEVKKDVWQNYHIVPLAGCIHLCRYCYLQYYFSNRWRTPVVYANVNDMVKEIREVFERQNNRRIFFSAGEVNDVLALDHITHTSRILSDVFKENENAILEMRTKSANIEEFIKSTASANIIPSWSLNTNYIINKYEPYSATLSKRLEAMRICQGYGFKVGLRLEPIFFYPNWEEEYKSIIDEIKRTLIPEMIEGITLGTPKFHQQMLEILEKNNLTELLKGEFIYSPNGKYTYCRDIRIQIYKKLYAHICETFVDTQRQNNIPVGLSMEPIWLWRIVFGDDYEKICLMNTIATQNC